MIKKIITHDGIFHADEVFAVALIRIVMGKAIPIERTRSILAEEFENSSIWIVDVGGRFEPELNNLDHHQNPNLEAACMLVLRRLAADNKVSNELLDELKYGFSAISHYDCNGYDENQPLGFQVSSLIKALNNLEGGFEKALLVAETYVLAARASAETSMESIQLWSEGKVTGNIRVCAKYPIHWKRYSGEAYMVCPHLDGKRWCVHSRDSSANPVLSTGQEEFIHANKFLAIFSDYFEAFACAMHSDRGMI